MIKYLRVLLLLAFLQSFPVEPMAFYKSNCTPGERKQQSNFPGSIEYWFQIDADSGEPHETLWPLKVEADGG